MRKTKILLSHLNYCDYHDHNNGFDDEHGSELATDVLTTYHSDESIEDGVNYYVCTTHFKDKERSYLLAILNENSSEDREIRSFLEEYQS